MTGGAIGSLIGQFFHITGAERKTLLVAGAVAGMTAVFGTPIAAVLLAVELLLFELRPRSLLPVAIACAVAGFARPLLLDAGPLFPLQTLPVGPLDLLSLRVWQAVRCHEPCRHRFTKSKIYSASCRFTGCGGRRWADWLSASAAICSRAHSVSAMT
jgi:hypothetical protein